MSRGTRGKPHQQPPMGLISQGRSTAQKLQTQGRTSQPTSPRGHLPAWQRAILLRSLPQLGGLPPLTAALRGPRPLPTPAARPRMHPVTAACCPAACTTAADTDAAPCMQAPTQAHYSLQRWRVPVQQGGLEHWCAGGAGGWGLECCSGALPIIRL